MRYLIMTFAAFAIFVTGCNTTTQAQEAEAEAPEAQLMSADTLKSLIMSFDEDAVAEGNAVQFTLQERDLLMVYDEAADRMRVITPITNAALMDEALMERVLQANFDAVLDARYAVANDLVWAVYIHKLSTVTQDDFLSAIAQTVTAAETFGTSFTSGAMVFGGGDSSEIHSDLLEQLEKALEDADKGTGI